MKRQPPENPNQERVRYAAPARAVVLAHVRIPSVNPCLGALTLISSDVSVEFSFLCLACEHLEMFREWDYGLFGCFDDVTTCIVEM